MKILLIDDTNFQDYPTGGILGFDRTMLSAFGEDLILAGISTDVNTPVGIWSQKKLLDCKFDFFSVGKERKMSKKPFVPRRIKLYLFFKKYIKSIISHDGYDLIITQCPEVLSLLPNSAFKKTCFISPGLSNPLSISRYKWARNFGFLYDKFILMPKVSKVHWLLAAGDKTSRDSFARRSRGKIKADKIIEFPTRYDDKYYYIIDRDEARNKLKIAHDSLIYTTVGRLNWHKGWKLMIDAFEKVHSFNSDSYLYFIGDGEDEDVILHYITTRKLNKNVFLLGKHTQKDIAMYLNASNAFVMGSYKEGWSTTLVEACACCVPCVITNFSSAKEMVTDGKNGYVIKNRDEQVFANRMIEVVSFDRKKIILHNRRFTNLAVSNLKADLNKILNDKR